MNAEPKIILHAVTNEAHNAFVGLRIRNGQIHFHYPEAYDLAPLEDKKAFRQDVVSIIRTISLAKSRTAVSNTTENGSVHQEQFAVLSYLWMIRDYLANGYYRNSEKIYRINGTGRINWKKTLATQPIVSGGNVIYDKIVVEARNDCDDVITRAHKWCVFDSVRKIGWLFGLKEKSVYVPRTADALIKKYIRAIKAELARTFDDGKKVRLGHMLKILAGADDSDRTREIVYGVDKYHYVYERMVDHVFSNVPDITKYNPNASWYLKKNDYEPVAAPSLRPDTVRLEAIKDSPGGKTAYILDAKLYRFGVTGKERDLPPTTSIQKQITYGDNILWNLQKTERIQQVHNAFILPYNKKKNPFGYGGDLEYIGYSEANWRKDGLAHQRVCAFLMDMKHLTTTWVYGNCGADIEKLISEITAAVEKAV